MEVSTIMMVNATINSTRVNPPCVFRRLLIVATSLFTLRLPDDHQYARCLHLYGLLGRVLQPPLGKLNRGVPFAHSGEGERQQRTSAAHTRRSSHAIYANGGFSRVVANVEAGRLNLAVLREQRAGGDHV